jgi:uncharacterized protein (DUF427 family)/predicted SnoaL-like aldol condensation-catalyzing enzyme
MKEKQVKLPGPDHPISIQRNPARVVVSVAGRAVADTRNALTLREAAYPPVQYIPGEDVDFSQLERTDYVTYCPYKGDCNYYSVPAGGKESINAVWSYEDPFPAVVQTTGHVAFYPERVDRITEQFPMTADRDSERAKGHGIPARNNPMSRAKHETNKALVLEAFDTLFNKRDYVAAERYWSPHYIQHSAHIAPGREGLFNLIKSIPPTLKYEPGTIVAEGDLVIVHGRFSGFGAPVNWIAADILRIQNGILVEHWDVIQDEATEEQSISKRPMFGTTFPTYA